MPDLATIQAAAERFAEVDSAPRRFGPGIEPCTCGAGRHEHAGRTLRGRCERTGCKRYRRDPVDMLTEAALRADQRGLAADLAIADAKHTRKRGQRKHEGEVRVSASDVSACRRKVQYRERPPADLYLSPSDKRAAFVGSLIHDAAVRVRKPMYPWRLFEQSVEIPGLGTSQYDMFDPITGKVDDTKTAGSWKWDVVTDYGPPPSEWKQVLMYGLALEHAGHKVRTVQITYINREKGRDQPFERPYVRAEAEAAVAGLTTLATQIELGIEQPRDEPGPGLSALCSHYCEFRDYCWEVPQAEAAQRSPQSWIRLGPTPAEPDITEALVEYREHQQAESAAKKAKAEARAVLDGIKPDRYGDLKLGNSPTERADQKAYIERIRRWGESDPATRGAFEDIEVPKTTSMTLRVGPVPKAVLEKEAKERAKAFDALAEATALEGSK